MCLRKHALSGARIPPGKGAIYFGGGAPAAVRPFSKIFDHLLTAACICVLVKNRWIDLHCTCSHMIFTLPHNRVLAKYTSLNLALRWQTKRVSQDHIITNRVSCTSVSKSYQYLQRSQTLTYAIVRNTAADNFVSQLQTSISCRWLTGATQSCCRQSLSIAV